MLLLNLMTGASSETRLFLLVWAAHVDQKAESKALEDMIAMGIPKRCFPGALEYLVREGFMWKIKSPKGRVARNKYLGGFDYGLTDRCFWLFQATLDKIYWTGEFLYLLNSPSITGSNDPQTITLEMRLLWVWLVSQSNPAGFIVGVDHQTAGVVLGMPANKVIKSFNALIEKNHVSQLSAKVPKSELFDELLPIYKIYPAKSDRKIIKLGIPVHSHNLKSLSFLRHMIDYHTKVSKLADKTRFPAQTSGLPDADYYKLSKIIANHDLIEALEWRSMLTMLQLIPEYASFVDSDVGHSVEKKSDFLWDRICEVLVQLMPGNTALEQEIETLDATDCDSDHTIQGPTMWEYTVRTITEELSSEIRRLSPQWSCYRKIHTGFDVKLVGYSPDAQIVVRLTNRVVKDEAPEVQEETTTCVYIGFSDAFEVLVPVNNEFQTGIIIDGQFLASIPNKTKK